MSILKIGNFKEKWFFFEENKAIHERSTRKLKAKGCHPNQYDEVVESRRTES